MSIVSLNDLVSVTTQPAALALELSIAQSLGLSVTSWQPLDPSRTILQVNSFIIAQYSATVNLTAQGGYASYASLMVDSNGTPITTWMDLIASDQYNVFRVPASFAAGPVPYSNSSAATYPYTPNAPLHFQHPTTGATYTSSGSGSIAPGAGTVTVVADAGFPGSLGNAGAGVILGLVTPLAGVSTTALTQPLIGTPQETNGNLFVRCKNKLGTLSAIGQLGVVGSPTAPTAGGAPQAYQFVATTVPLGAVASSVFPYAVTAAITRVQVQAFGSGLVNVYLANAAGTPPAGDVAAVKAAIFALAVPQAVTCQVFGATAFVMPITYRVFVKASGNLTDTQIKTNISNALATYFSQVPVGGLNVNGMLNVVPTSEIIDVIFNANPGTVDLVVSIPATAYTAVGNGFVPTLGVITAAVVQV
jgi:hypothetical protein